jgi:SynChlorMet cassette radical SAM/SPASM protein ScmE
MNPTSEHRSTPELMRTPRSLDIEITSRCNLRCGYCYYFANSAVSYQDLPAVEWLTFFEELGRAGVMRVTLQGGEPFTRADLPALIDGIVRNRMRFSILSNGTLMDDAIAGRIAATGRCDHVQVSIDGSCPEVHDATRGDGAFVRAIQGLRTLMAHKIPVAVRVTITRHNVNDLERTARLLLEDIGVPAFGTNSAGYLGMCRMNATELLLDVESRMQAMRTLTELAARYPNRLLANAGPLADARAWTAMEEARRGQAPPPSGGGRLTGCGCTFSSIAVRADGTLVPCVLLAHLELGRINRESLASVWREHPALRDLRARFEQPLAAFEHCAGCPYVPHCTGNCPALSYTVFGTINHPSPTAVCVPSSRRVAACLNRHECFGQNSAAGNRIFLPDGRLQPRLPPLLARP